MPSRTAGPCCRAPRSAGFSLLEMLAVIVLIGIVAGIVVRSVVRNLDRGKCDAARAQVHSLGQKIESYIVDLDDPPARLEDLVARPANAVRWRGPYAKSSELSDPFGHPYAYKAPGEHSDFDLAFLGKDGKSGGVDVDEDVGNWQ